MQNDNHKAVTRSIVGYKKEESDMLLKFLYDHIAYGADFHARIKWQEKTVIVWDVSRIQASQVVRAIFLNDLSVAESRDMSFRHP